MRFLRKSLVGVFLISITLGLLAMAGNTVRRAVQDRLNEEPRSFPQRERVFAVNVIHVEPSEITPVLTVFGELQSERMLEVRSTVGGTILETAEALVEGGLVSQGQQLLRVDPATATAARDRTAVDLQDAEAELRDAERALVLAQDELAAAWEQAELREQALSRSKDLRERGVSTESAVEAAEFSRSSANASVLSRRQSLANAEARIDLSKTRLLRTQIDLNEANLALGDTEVIAVFDGALTDISASIGGRLSPNERFATLLDPNKLEVAFRVSTSQYAQLLDVDGSLIEAEISIMLDVSGIDLVAQGRIARENATVGEGQTGRLLFARIESSRGFRPGDFVTVQISQQSLEDVALVPDSAVGADETVLVVNADDRLEIEQTQIIQRQGDNVLIRVGGLAGKRIIAERSPLLGAGIGVKPLLSNGEVAEPETPALIILEPERRAKLVAFVEDSRMPEEVKARIMSQLDQQEVPAEVVARLEDRMGN